MTTLRPANEYVSVDLIRDRTGFNELKHEWCALLESSPFKDVMLSYQWFDCWSKQFVADGDMLMITVRDAGRLIVVLPLMRHHFSKYGMKLKIVKSMTNEPSVKFDIISEKLSPRLLARLLKIAFDDSRTHMMVLDHVSEHSSILQHLDQAIDATGYKSIVRAESGNAQLHVQGTFDTYYSSLKRRIRKNFRNSENRAQGYGELTLIQPQSTAQLSDILKRGFILEASGWKGKAKTAVLKNQKLLSFYNNLALTAYAAGWLDILLLKHQTDDIAFVYNLGHFGTVYGLIMGSSERYKKLSPGMLILKKLLMKTFDEKIYSRLDFGGGKDTWKKNFANDREKYYKVFLFKNNILGKSLHYLAKIYDETHKT